jgi:hypothetical protein
MLEAEQEMNAGKVSLALLDSLRHRQEWCTVINSHFGWGAWCEVSEPTIGIDRDGDGEVSSENTETMTNEGGNNNADNV